jgi:inhibitor of growth protein 3
MPAYNKSRTDRPPSPSESLVSVTSHPPSQNTHHPNGTSSARGASSTHHNHALAPNVGRATNGSNFPATKRRSGAGQNSNNNRVSTPLSNDYPPHNPASALSSHRAAGNGLPSANHHPSSSSNLGLYANGTGTSLANGNAAHYYDNVPPHSMSGTPDLGVPSAQLLAGPGVPFARSTSVHSAVTAANGTTGGRTSSTNAANSAGAEGAGDEGDNDDGRTYCYCDSVSYGEMIACDDENCEREWVSHPS